MTPNDLIFCLRQDGFTVKADGNYLDISPADLSPELVQQLKQSKAAILAVLKHEQQQEARQEKVLAMMEAAPSTRYAVYVEDASTNPVIATIAIREVATFEMAIPRHSYDGMVLLELIEQHYGETNVNT